jgi:hypothetical protein
MNSHHHQPLHYSPIRHFIRYGVVITLLSCSVALSANALANSPENQPVTNMAAASNSPIETITVTYRNTFDYALYQHTTEMLLSFNRDLSQSNVINAQQQSRQMAAEFGLSVAESITFSLDDKTLLLSGLSQSLNSNE